VTKLFVGSLPWATTSDDLKDMFSQAGNVVSATVIMDKFTGRSKGFGFVELEDADAQKAIEMFDNSDYQGRQLKVNVARPMEDRPPRRNNFGGNGGGRGGFGGHSGGHRDQY
jgi:RNA recognition motif-containing protein